MERILLYIIVFTHQIAQCQVNLNFDIDAQKLTPMKLSDISAESRFVTLNTESIVDYIATDRFLFVSQGEKGQVLGNKLFQYDLSGKLINTFYNDNKTFGFRCDSKNNRLILLHGDIAVWDFNGIFLKKITLPVVESINGFPKILRTVIGFDQNCVWMLQQFERNGKICCQICQLNVESERIEIVLERYFPIPEIGEFKLTYSVQYSSFGGKSYINFDDNMIYEVDGKNVRPAVKYNILNYRGEFLRNLQESRFVGRYLVIKYGHNFADYMLFWYDTKEKRTWQVRGHNFKGGIEDDIFHTGTCDNYQIKGDYLVFRKKSNELPKEMNIEKEHTVFFITKLKQ